MSLILIGHVLWIMFVWPNGIVVGNLLASAITGTLAFLWARWHFGKKVQSLHDKLDALHDKHNALLERLDNGNSH